MSQVTVHNTECGKGSVVNPFFLKVENTLEAVRKRAFQRFEERGGVSGGETGDWLQAERDLFFVPASEFAETDKDFTIMLKMAGFEDADIEVMTRQREIMVHAKKETCQSGKCASGDKNGTVCEIGSKALYRHFDLPANIDAGKVKARLHNGVLTIEAPKDAPKNTAPPVRVRSVAA